MGCHSVGLTALRRIEATDRRVRVQGRPLLHWVAAGEHVSQTRVDTASCDVAAVRTIPGMNR